MAYFEFELVKMLRKRTKSTFHGMVVNHCGCDCIRFASIAQLMLLER
jgi:hypothetical protein